MGGLLMPMEIVRQLPYDHPYRWDGTLFGGPKLWRPNELGSSLAMWLDAEDTSTITLNGTTVSQWADKSGNGRNAAQPTAVNQPFLAVGRNLLKYSEEFNNAFWTKRGTVAITPNDTTAPNGTLTADRVSGLNTTTNDIFNSNYLSFVMGTPVASYTPSIYVKRISTTGTFSIGNTVNDNLYGRWTIDLSQLPDAWVRITATTTGVTVNVPFVFDPTGYGGILLRGVTGGALSMHIWGAQINPGTTADAYQQTISAVQPVLSGINGKATVTFNASSSSWMTTGTLNVAMQNDYTVLSVLLTNNASSNAQWYLCPGFLGGEAGGTGADHGLGFNGLSPITGIGNPDTLYQATNAVTSNTATILSWDRTSSTGVLNWFKDGTANGTATGATGARTYNSSLSLGAMSQSGAFGYLTFTAGEIVVASSVLSVENRQRLEGYLAWKWGREANLPSGHPYKLLPPTV